MEPKGKNWTPGKATLEQFHDHLRLKNDAGGAILFFRFGEDHVAFFDDAYIVNHYMGLPLRGIEGCPQCRIAPDMKEKCVERLLDLSMKVAFCELVSGLNTLIDMALKKQPRSGRFPKMELRAPVKEMRNDRCKNHIQGGKIMKKINDQNDSKSLAADPSVIRMNEKLKRLDKISKVVKMAIKRKQPDIDNIVRTMSENEYSSFHQMNADRIRLLADKINLLRS